MHSYVVFLWTLGQRAFLERGDTCKIKEARNGFTLFRHREGSGMAGT